MLGDHLETTSQGSGGAPGAHNINIILSGKLPRTGFLPEEYPFAVRNHHLMYGDDTACMREKRPCATVRAVQAASSTTGSACNIEHQQNGNNSLLHCTKLHKKQNCSYAWRIQISHSALQIAGQSGCALRKGLAGNREAARL